MSEKRRVAIIGPVNDELMDALCKQLSDKPAATGSGEPPQSECPFCGGSGTWKYDVLARPASQPTVTLSDIDATFTRDTILMTLKWLRPYDYTSDMAKQTIARLNRVLALLQAADGQK